MPEDCVQPKPGERWEHADGGTIYVRRVRGDMVTIQRRPFGDNLAEPYPIRMEIFQKIQRGKLA